MVWHLLLWRSIRAGGKWKGDWVYGMWDVPVSSWDKTAYLLQHAKGSISKGRSRSRSRSTTTSPAPQESENLKTETEP